MAKVQFNYRKLAEKMTRSVSGMEKANSLISRRFEVAKADFLEKLFDHPVSQEIFDGIVDPVDTPNNSETLGGYGNLYSFIGFENGFDPITPVLALLERQMKIIRQKTTILNRQKKEAGVRISYSRKVPRAELEEITETEWSGESWLFGIERGISGFNNYMNARFRNPPSRSEGGVQTKNNLRGGNFQPVPYFEALLAEFDQEFRESI